MLVSNHVFNLQHPTAEHWALWPCSKGSYLFTTKLTIHGNLLYLKIIFTIFSIMTKHFLMILRF